MRFTLDSNILVRAVMSPLGPAFRVLDAILDAHTLVLSRFILDEVHRVLLYPRIQTRYRVSADEIVRFAGNLAEVAHLIEPTIVKPLVELDPNDDPVLYTAAEGRADILCTKNIRHFSSPAVKHFCNEHGIRVMTDTDVLRDLLPAPQLPPGTQSSA